MKPTVTVLVHREHQISFAVAGSCRAAGYSPLTAARSAAAHYFGAPECRVTVEPTVVGEDGSAVVQATLQPPRSPIAWELLKWALACVLVAAICWAIWKGGAS